MCVSHQLKEVVHEKHPVMRKLLTDEVSDLKGVTSVQDSILKFQIDKYEVDDTDTANQVNHFQTCHCKGVEII